MIEAEIAIVGAGPAGLAAAVAAAESGCRVTVLDAYERPGGQFYRQLPPELHAANPRALHPHAGDVERRYNRALELPNIRWLAGATVWTARPGAAPGDPFVLYTDTAGRASEVRAGVVIIATGAFERVLPFPGWDLPGVITAGAAQTLVKSQRVLPGRRVVVAGAGPFLLPVAAGLAESGAQVLAVYEATSPTRWARHGPALWGNGGKLLEARDYLLTLHRHGVPLEFGRAVLQADGDKRVRRVSVTRLDQAWRPTSPAREHHEVDALCIGFGFVPSTELAIALGCDRYFSEAHGVALPRRDRDMQTSRPGVFVAGEAAGIGGASVATLQGTIAGYGAARSIGRLSAADAARAQAPYRAPLRRAMAFASAVNRIYALQPGCWEWPAPDTVVCRCEDVTLDEIRRAVEEHDVRDARGVKMVTRCGMGPCQGRMCGAAVAGLTARLTGRPLSDVGTFSERPLVKPVALGELAMY